MRSSKPPGRRNGMWSGDGLGDGRQDPEDEAGHRRDEEGTQGDLGGDLAAGVERRIGDHAHQTHDPPLWLRAATAIRPVAGGLKVWSRDVRKPNGCSRIITRPPETIVVAGSTTLPPYAELNCHTHFSFLDGASAPDDLVARAVELGLSALALTDHQGLYGAVRFTTAAEAAGLHPVVGIEIELLDAAVSDPGGLVVPRRRAWRPGRRPPVVADAPPVADGVPVRPRPDRTLLPGHRAVVKEDHRGIGEPQRGPHLVLLARDAIGWRSLCRMVSRANLAGTKAVPRFTQALLEEHHEGLIALSA